MANFLGGIASNPIMRTGLTAAATSYGGPAAGMAANAALGMVDQANQPGLPRQGASAAQAQHQLATNQAMRQQMALINAASGQNGGMAMRTAALQGGQMLGDAANRSAMLRAQEDQAFRQYQMQVQQQQFAQQKGSRDQAQLMQNALWKGILDKGATENAANVSSPNADMALATSELEGRGDFTPMPASQPMPVQGGVAGPFLSGIGQNPWGVYG